MLHLVRNDGVGNIVVGFTNLTSSMNEYLQIPASEKMEKERIEVNSLVISLKDQNLTSDVRNKIYNKLKDLSPAILEGIDKENISTSILTDNLNKYNAETIYGTSKKCFFIVGLQFQNPR